MINVVIRLTRMALNTYASEISQALVAAAEVAIPHTSEVGCNRSKPIPGWTEFVEPLKAKSLFWPMFGLTVIGKRQVMSLMKRSRALYH